MEAEREQGGEAPDLRGVLLRSFSDLRRQVSTRRIVHTTASVKAAVAEKLNELEELTQELMARPAIDPVPLDRRRTCAQCGDVFAAVVEGGQCMGSRPFDFLCSLCWGAFSSSISPLAQTTAYPDLRRVGLRRVYHARVLRGRRVRARDRRRRRRRHLGPRSAAVSAAPFPAFSRA